MSLFRTFILALSALGLVIGGFLAYLYRWVMTRPVPDLDGRVTLAILDGPVTIRRDRHGIPHIRASTKADVFRAQGYVHAQDRLWQMEQTRRIASGTLAALFGEAALPADRYCRTIGFRRSARQELDQLWPQERALLDWYCEGVNAYMQERRGRLAAEFGLLRCEPEAWTPTDCLAVAKLVAWSMSVNWDSELLRLLLAGQMGLDRTVQMEPVTLASPSILDTADPTETEQILLTAEALLAEYQKVKTFMPLSEPGQGSNCWTVAGARTASGHTLMCNDPHLQVALPCALYEQHLTGGGLDAAGAMFPGAPGIVFGHNEHMAWGITNACTDVQDLFVERIDPKRPDHYDRAGQWHPLEQHTELFQIRGQDKPVTAQVRLTHHGPLITDVVPETAGMPLALQWTGHMPGHTFHCLWELLHAQSCQEGIQAFAHWNVPTLNLSLADTEGNIDYILIGRHPVRHTGLGLLPNAGWEGTGEWIDFIPFDRHPGLHNPEGGVIVHANNRMVDGNSPYWFGCEFDPGYRARRIAERLDQHPFPSLVDMRRLQVDTHSGYAAALLPELLPYEFDDEWEKHALKVLAAWNQCMEVDSEGAFIFHHIFNSLLHEAFGAKLEDLAQHYLGRSFSPLALLGAFRMTAQMHLLDLLQNHRTSAWYAGADGRERTREEFVRVAVARAVSQMRANMGEATRKWDWGRIHQIKFTHILSSAWLLRPFRPLLNRGPFPLAGDGTTILQATYALGAAQGLALVVPAYRAVMEVGNWDTMLSVINTGQSGHPVSRHYDDQIGMWREGEYHIMPFTPQAVDEIAIFTLHLEPEDPSRRPEAVPGEQTP